MTTITMGAGFQLNMAPGGGTLADLAAAAVQSVTATEVVVQGGGPTYTMVGTGFAGDDGSGRPTQGVVNAFTVAFGVFPIATITDFAMSWPKFWGFVGPDDYHGFLKHLLRANDTVSGEAGADVLNGFKGFDDIYGGAGNDILIGGRGGDALYGGDDDDFLRAEAGDGDVLDGGSGTDTAAFRDGGTLALGGSMTGIEILRLAGAAAFDVSMDDDNVAAGETLVVNAGALSTGVAGRIVLNGAPPPALLTFDGSAESDGRFIVYATGGDDILMGGAQSDSFHLARGGADTLRYTAVAQSTGTTHDIVNGFDADADSFDLHIAVAGFEGTFNANVDQATFDNDMGVFFSDNIHANEAWVVHASSGDLIGHDFLVIDVDGDSFYTSGADYVIDITGYTGTLDASDFI